MSKTTYHPKKTLRVPKETLAQIPDGNFSAWVLNAIHQSLALEKGISHNYLQTSSLMLQELVSQGRDLNSLAKSAQKGEVVVLDPKTLSQYLQVLQELKQAVLEVRQKLS